jgi:uncharacterized protein
LVAVWRQAPGRGGRTIVDLRTRGLIAMAQRADSIDLTRVAPSPGDGRRLEVDVVPGELSYGDVAYAVEGDAATARLDVSRTVGGYALRLRFSAKVAGACVRCLEPAEVAVEVDAREVEQPAATDEELRSPYMDGDELDVRSWAHDALALAMPWQFLCRADCAGLCAVCGASLNDADPAEHEHGGGGDPRWDKLRELKLE